MKNEKEKRKKKKEKKKKEKKKTKRKKKRQKKKEKKVRKASVPKPVTPATGYQAPAPACIDGWTDGRMDGWTDGQAKSKKIMYFKHFSKTIRYFFLVVSRPLRRVFKKFFKYVIFFDFRDPSTITHLSPIHPSIKSRESKMSRYPVSIEVKKT